VIVEVNIHRAQGNRLLMAAIDRRAKHIIGLRMRLNEALMRDTSYMTWPQGRI